MADAREPLASPGRNPGSTRALVALLAFVLGFATVPHRVMEREANDWFRGTPAEADALAAGVARWTRSPEELAPASFGTGSSRFDHEWLFGTYSMAAMGFGQLASARPPDDPRRAEDLARMERCIAAMLEAPRLRAFDADAWGIDPIASLGTAPGTRPDRGHAAYLGYVGAALSLHRLLRPSSPFTQREEAVTKALARRIEASKTGLIETYPDETYPVDNTAGLAALALHAQATNEAPSPALARGIDAINRARDRATGLLVQSVNADASVRDGPRGSGTALAAYFLSFADVPTSRALFVALEHSQFRTVLGFGGMLERPPSASKDAAADIDSGPVVLGVGVSATGFALGASRAHDDRDVFTALLATAQLFGAPLDEDGARRYAMGGPLGDAILLAMLTAPRATRSP